MIVDLDYLQTVKKRLDEINNTDTEDITFIKDGQEVRFDTNDIASCNKMGLTVTELACVLPYTLV